MNDFILIVLMALCVLPFGSVRAGPDLLPGLGRASSNRIQAKLDEHPHLHEHMFVLCWSPSMVEPARTTMSHDDQYLTELVDGLLEMTPLLECDRPAVALLRGAVARHGRVKGARLFVQSWVRREQDRNNYVPDWALELYDQSRSIYRHDLRLFGGSPTLKAAAENGGPVSVLARVADVLQKGFLRPHQVAPMQRATNGSGCDRILKVRNNTPFGRPWTAPNQRHEADGQSFSVPVFEKTSALLAAVEFTGEPPPLESPVQAPIMRTAPPRRFTVRNVCANL